MPRGRRPSMVPLDQQMSDDDEMVVGGRGKGTRYRRTLAERIADAQRELNELRWGGVQDAANLISTTVEALDEGEDKNQLFDIYRRLTELMEKNGIVAHKEHNGSE